MRPLRIFVGLFLALVVATINGLAGYGYLGLGLLDATWADHSEDPRWERAETEEGTRYQPKDGAAALSIYTDSAHGRFGAFLLALCSLQFVAGSMLVFSPRAGRIRLAFFGSVAALGILAEVLGVWFSSSLGPTNLLGILFSTLLAVVAVSSYRRC